MKCSSANKHYPRVPELGLVPLLIALYLFTCSLAYSAAQDAPANPPVKAAAPAKPKHVITNEDLEPHPVTSGPDSQKPLLTAQSAILTCDSLCEQEARSRLYYDSDHEGEWRSQIVKARRDLIDDANWRQLLLQVLQQSDNYCRLALQQSQQLSSNRSDFRSRTQRARNDQYFENMSHALQQQLVNTSSRMQDHIQEVQELSPVRATLMSVQAERALQRPCQRPDRH